MALNPPERDQRAFREPSLNLRLVALCVLSITLMALDNRNQYIEDARRMLGVAVYPFRVLVDTPFSIGNWAGESFSTRRALQQSNDDLRRRIAIQSAQVQQLVALKAENDRLRALLDSTTKVGDKVLIAEIMSVDMDPFRHRIVVNKGSSDGAYVSQALIDAQGIVGQITRDQVFSSEAILITDVDHALPVELVRNRLRTIAVGTGQFDRLSLPYLPRNADVVEGDLLVTSGLGGVFPPGYPVGTVSEVISDAGETFLAVSAVPSAALNRIREVLLIRPGDVGRPALTALPEAGAPAEDEAPAEVAATDAAQASGEAIEMTDDTAGTSLERADSPAADAPAGESRE